jgi:hypothetical protein
MNTAPTIDTGRRELAGRVSGGLEITLYWNPADDGISVEVYEASIDETITILVAPDRALEAFHHPFAYLASDYDIVGILLSSAGLTS